MFDTQRSVKVLFDENFEGKKVIIHPLRNTASINISFDDLKRFVEHYGHTYQLAYVYQDSALCVMQQNKSYIIFSKKGVSSSVEKHLKNLSGYSVVTLDDLFLSE